MSLSSRSFPASERIYIGRNKSLKKRRALKTAAIILGVFALLFVAYEIFTLKVIKVEGSKNIPQDDIIAVSGLKTGSSIFFTDTEKAMDALSYDIRIKPLSVSVEYPNCVVITIKEREPAACIIRDETVLVIDEDGYLLDITEKPDEPALPVVTGISLEQYSTGAKLGASDAFQLNVLSKVLIETKNAGLELSGVDISIPADVVIAIKDGFLIETGDDLDLEFKLEIAKASIEKLKGMGKTDGIVNVSSGTNAYYREK